MIIYDISYYKFAYSRLIFLTEMILTCICVRLESTVSV